MPANHPESSGSLRRSRFMRSAGLAQEHQEDDLKISRPMAMAATGVVALGILGTGSAFAAGRAVAPKLIALYGCASKSGAVGTLYDKPVTCKSGYSLVESGARGPRGAQGATGGQGPRGATGPAGQSGILSVSATTQITNWPESSGWANDNFTRTVTLTRQGAAPASDCGATAATCWFYTETLADNGTFTTVNGAASPNGSSAATIEGNLSGIEEGAAKLEFYASSGSPNPQLVPGTATGANRPSTSTSWYELFFPSGTQFGLAPAQVSGYGPWTTYDWTYSLNVPCGSGKAVSETWNDGINPGDDGQGANDGNITGTAAC
jgi:hypothetical protein